MKTKSKIVGKYRVFATQIQDNLVSCDAMENIDRANGSSFKSQFKEIIYKTNNIDGALEQYIRDEVLKIGN